MCPEVGEECGLYNPSWGCFYKYWKDGKMQGNCPKEKNRK